MRNSVFVLCLIALFLSPVVFFLWFNLSGFQLVSTEGTSMEPFIAPGSALLMQTHFDAYSIPNGTVVSYRCNWYNREVTHRIIDVETGYYVCKGDNNPVPDPLVYPDNITGILVCVIWKGR